MSPIPRRHLLKLGAAATIILPTYARAQDAALARTPLGALQGQRGDGVLAFKGIPYAAPPIGPLRFRSPQPPSPRQGVREATRPGAASIQTIPPWAAWLYAQPAAMDEDCLFLNVWTPALSGRRPVMVWIHGGAWRTGEGAAAGNDGAALARTGDVVVVTINYRLNALGFLAHPDLRDPETGAAANWGVQDQWAALRWVRDTIEAFGGDPENITLFGQSAGGTSVANFVQNAPDAALVRKGIIQSGALFGPPLLPDMEGAARYADALAKKLDTTVAGLRAVPAAALHTTELALAREWQTQTNGWRVPILPIVDGSVIRTAPRDAGLPAIPLLIGSNRSEATFWYDLVGPDGKPIPGLPAPKDEASLTTMLRSLASAYRPGTKDAAPEAIIAAYRDAAAKRGEPTDVKSLWLSLYTDLGYRLDARAMARRHAAADHPAFLYEFVQPLAAPAHGVPHCAEIPFVFGTNGDPYFAGKSGVGPEEARLARVMMEGWSGFARSGTPSSQQGGNWLPVATDGSGINVLGGGSNPRQVVPVLRSEELSCWASA